jgi:hypothetical protein
LVVRATVAASTGRNAGVLAAGRQRVHGAFFCLRALRSEGPRCALPPPTHSVAPRLSEPESVTYGRFLVGFLISIRQMSYFNPAFAYFHPA